MASEEFLTEKQEEHIIDAIAEAERQTSGEIRVHIEHRCPGEALGRADTLFHELGMDETRLQNGVLIYIASDDHKAAIYGGKGINERVEEGFWEDVMEILIDHFKKGEFEFGIARAVTKVGDKLREYFPYKRTDTNELSDEISYHANR